MVADNIVRLIPWDPESPQHIERLKEQRVQCGWHEERVENPWAQLQKSGYKCIYWIVFSLGYPSKSAGLQLLRSKYPKEKESLRDTGKSIHGVLHQPSLATIHPIGHISLDVDNPDATHLGLDLPSSDIYWIKSLYISFALQGQGLGRYAMDVVESMAMEEPLYAKTLVLDTVHKDHSLSALSNQEWYARRGYRLIMTVPDHYYPGGKTVFMRRDLT